MKYQITLLLFFVLGHLCAQDPIIVNENMATRNQIEMWIESGSTVIVTGSADNQSAIINKGNTWIETGKLPFVNESAAFEIRSKTKGFLLPRMSSKQRLKIKKPATGLIVNDTTLKSILMFSGQYDRSLYSGQADTFEYQNLIDKVYSESLFSVQYPIWETAMNTFQYQKTTEHTLSDGDSIYIGKHALNHSILEKTATGYQYIGATSCIRDSFVIDSLYISEDSVGFSWTSGVVWLAQDTSWNEVNVMPGDTVVAINSIYKVPATQSNTIWARPRRQCLERDVNYEIKMNNLGLRQLYLYWRDPVTTILIERY